MSQLSDLIRSLLDRLAGLLGLGSDERRQMRELERMEDELNSSKRDNTDAIHELKTQIRSLEARAMEKNRELKNTHGESKRVVVGEIERIFRELDRLRGKETIVAVNLDRIGLALAKIDEAKAARRRGVSEERFDSIAIELEGLLGKLHDSDQAADELERQKYEVAAPNHVDTEERMAKLTEEADSPAGLSPEIEQRLRKLEAEGA